MDLTERANAVDLELERFIARRASEDRRPDRDEQEALYMESVRRYNAGREAQMRAAWCQYHQDQAARHRVILEGLIAHHEEAAKLLESQR